VGSSVVKKQDQLGRQQHSTQVVVVPNVEKRMKNLERI